jgi:hypothetical protein
MNTRHVNYAIISGDRQGYLLHDALRFRPLPAPEPGREVIPLPADAWMGAHGAAINRLSRAWDVDHHAAVAKVVYHQG